MVVFYRSPCDNTTPPHQLNQPLRTSIPFNRVTETHREAPPSTQDAASYRIGLDQPLPLCSFPLSNAPIRSSSARSLKRGDNWEPVQPVEFNVILSAPQCTSSYLFSRRRCERRNQIFSTTTKVGRVTVTLGVGTGNIEEKSGERLGYRERSALNAQ